MLQDLCIIPGRLSLGLYLLNAFRKRGAKDILIMSPYRAQVALVKKIRDQKYPESLIRPRVQTVDASQGSEADAVIVLTTRNIGGVGFLQSTKRTNDWVRSKIFMKDAGKFYAYLHEAERVLRVEMKMEYAVGP
ncbi:hypothetical protein P170DRAFT_514617 [Aspergillus steynii IBT 23096]|uniref:DNA2/NAM7 helicase-like C-terminal domain-containing protein n=1 Tax=Aspergillus steynii IBT 23096 TaxID=1392250 RepID=A0A2I2FRZ8_9EURO|nr:uncharacterized protein P170DRAFT_514617 [Aspergillus steynii IBT 23096]PLB43389.1 hypothetical protein P170DRAFT_514617 [Aspergillus steynii IBT 23096]